MGFSALSEYKNALPLAVGVFFFTSFSFSVILLLYYFYYTTTIIMVIYMGCFSFILSLSLIYRLVVPVLVVVALVVFISYFSRRL